MRIAAACIGLASALALPWSLASADEGRVEINQARALSGGIPGDNAGFPVEITLPGAYVLTGRLEPPVGFIHAILVAANDVDIDLNGFAIAGTNVCVGTPVTSCPSPNLGDGVSVPDTGRYGLSVHGGSIRGMQRGIGARSNVRVWDVTAESNAFHGIHLDGDGSCEVFDVRVIRNRFVGLALRQCDARRIVATGNGSNGISGGSVSFAVASRNGADGINGIPATSIIWGVTAVGNGSDGVDSVSAVRWSTVAENASRGIAGTVGPTLGCVARQNGSFGINAGAPGNCSANANGVEIFGVELGENVCGGDLICP